MRNFIDNWIEILFGIQSPSKHMRGAYDNHYKDNIRLKKYLRVLFIILIIYTILLTFIGFDNLQLSEKLRNVTSENYKLQMQYKDLEITCNRLLEETRIEYQKDLKEQETKYINMLHRTSDYKNLVSTMNGEAGNQGIEGIKHCTSTVVNRVDSGKFPDTIQGVISAPRQYCAYGLTFEDINPDVKKAIDEVLLNGPINDAIYYMNPDASAPASRGWMRTKDFLFKYKDHEFYR